MADTSMSASAVASTKASGTLEPDLAPPSASPTQSVVMTALWSKLKKMSDDELSQWYKDHEAYDAKKDEK